MKQTTRWMLERSASLERQADNEDDEALGFEQHAATHRRAAMEKRATVQVFRTDAEKIEPGCLTEWNKEQEEQRRKTALQTGITVAGRYLIVN